MLTFLTFSSSFLFLQPYYMNNDELEIHLGQLRCKDEVSIELEN